MNYNAQKILTLTIKYFYSYLVLPMIFLSLGMLEGTPPSKPGTIIYPIQHNIIAHSPISNIKGEYDTSRIRTILILKPYSTKKRIQLTSEKEKMVFARELYTMIPNDLIIGGIKVRSNTENFEFQFQQRDQIDIERFWISNEMQKIWISIHSRQVVFADVELHGWQTTPFQNTPSARSKLKNLFSLSLLLKPGLNAFQLMFLDSLSSPVFIDSINIFYTIPTLAGSPPGGYAKGIFHTAANETKCLPCHSEGSLSAPSENLKCGSCHGKLTSLHSVHPPAEDCSMCHDLTSSKEFKLIEGQEFNNDFCYTCHDDIRELVETKPVVHAAVYECSTCHDPHGSTFDTVLRDRTINICKNCHEDQVNRPHPVANHPFEASEEYYRPGKKLTCTSCHNPHASDQPKLFRFPSQPICNHCHGKS